MSRRLFAFLLSEMAIVRVICQREHCRAVVEVPVSKLRDRYRNPICPFCQAEWTPPRTDNPLARLGQAVEDCKAMAAEVEIEFVLPDDRA